MAPHNRYYLLCVVLFNVNKTLIALFRVVNKLILQQRNIFFYIVAWSTVWNVTIYWVKPTKLNNLLRSLPCIDDPECSWFHAIHTPISDSFFIAYRDGKSAIISPDQVDHRTLLTRDMQSGPFAAIFRPSFETCKSNKMDRLG